MQLLVLHDSAQYALHRDCRTAEAFARTGKETFYTLVVHGLKDVKHVVLYERRGGGKEFPIGNVGSCNDYTASLCKKRFKEFVVGVGTPFHHAFG